MYLLCGCISRHKLQLFHRKEKFATQGYAGRRAQSSAAGVASVAAQGTAGRQRLHSRHAAPPAASRAASFAAAACSWPALSRAAPGSPVPQAGPAGNAQAASRGPAPSSSTAAGGAGWGRPTGYAAALLAPPSSSSPAATALQHVQHHQPQLQQQHQRPKQQQQQTAEVSVSGGLSEGASGSGDAVGQEGNDSTATLAQPETFQVNSELT